MMNLSKSLDSRSFYFTIDAARLFAPRTDNMMMMFFSMNFIMLFSMLREHWMNNIKEFKQIKNTIDCHSVHTKGFLDNFVWRKNTGMSSNNIRDVFTRRCYFLFFVRKDIENPLWVMFCIHINCNSIASILRNSVAHVNGYHGDKLRYTCKKDILRSYITIQNSMKSFVIGIIAILAVGGIFFFYFSRLPVGEQETQQKTDDHPSAVGQLPAEDEIPATEETTAPPEIVVEDQAYTNGGITIQSVNTQEDIWLVAYDDDMGKPGRIIGQVTLSPGSWSDVAFPLYESFVTDPIYIAVHKDAGASGTFEFPGADVALSIDGVVVVKTVHVTK